MKKHYFLQLFYKLIFPILCILSFELYAQSPSLNEFDQFFKSGKYQKALNSLSSIDPNNFKPGEKSYYEGICHSKLQEYESAIKSFELAINEKNENRDLQYEYGQALYAANELKAARRAFKESAKLKFNESASIYYIAHISQILEEYEEAKTYYTELIKNKEADVKIKQIARFQLSETLLLMMRERVKNRETLEKGVDKFILPLMKEAYEVDKSTQVSFEITQRIHELEKEFNLDPNLLKNGRRISPKRSSGYFLEKIKFDDNISLTNEENNISQSKKESYIFEFEAYTKHDFIFKKKIVTSPEIRANFSQNSDQDNSEVYQNDAFTINANLKNKYEHNVHALPASFLFDIEYGKIFKDWKQRHARESYADTLTFGIGEAFNYFSFGDTSFKFKWKNFYGENETISNHTISFSGDQTIILPNQHLLITLLQADFIDNFNNPSSSTNTYLMRIDYLISDLIPKYTLGLALATTITDTKEQKVSRGFESTINPSMDFSKEINNQMKISINYDFTKNKSKLSSYDYKKHVFSTELRYSF